jgi:hypothetical protein
MAFNLGVNRKAHAPLEHESAGLELAMSGRKP